MRRAFLAAFVVLTAAAQTKIDLRTQAKGVDFTAATATKPVKTGTALPGTCTVGEMFFKTDAPAGANLYGCTSADTWSVQSGIPSQDCWYDSTDGTLKCRDAGGNVYAAVKTSSGSTPNQWVDYISPAGIPHTSQPNAAAVGALGDSGTNGIPYRSGPGTTSPAGADNLSAVFSCQDAGALNAYACNLTPPIGAYTAGTSYWFKANTANTGSATVNFNGLGTKLIVKQVTQQLTAGDIKAGQWVIITYDGVVMQMQSQTANPGSGAVSSVFGRTGPVAAQNGDYTTAQVTESGNLYFTNARAQQAFSYPGVVNFSAGALDCPTCITAATAADTDLYGQFPHLSVVKLQGRRVAATQPADQQYLGWNNSASQWEPKTLPALSVSSVFGRSGSVTAQGGDYAFSQISGAVATGQLPATVMRADSDNTVTGGTQDLRGANHTLPMKSGLTAALPATCQAGETYFATDAPAGNNVYGCTAANTWSPQGTNLTVASEGTVIGWRPKVNFQTGPGLLSVIADTGSEIDILWALDTAVNQTQPGEQSGSALLCASASGSNRNYQCSLTPTLGAYTAGMALHWKPDVNGAGGTTTLNVDTLGAVPVTLSDGASAPGATDIVAGQLYNIWYDGAQFRLMTPVSSLGSGSVSSVFGRQGTIAAQAGDYTTDQITEGGKLYFTSDRALAAVTWGSLTGKPSTFAASAHAATHQNGGGDEVGTSTPTANAIPKAGAGGTLASGWIPVLNQNTTGTAAALAAQYTDWNAPSGGASIANKPAIPSIASTNSVLKGNGSGNAVAATSGTDYAPATSGTAPLKGDGAGGTSAAGYSDIVGLWTTCSGYLKSNGTCDTPSGLTNPMAGIGDLIYGGSAGAATKLSGDTSNTRKFLREQSTIGNPAAPVWDTIQAADVPTLNQITTGTAAGLTSQYIDWNASSGGASIANKPTLGTASSWGDVFDGSTTSLQDGSTVSWSTVGNQYQASWTVPAGVHQLRVQSWGAGGGGQTGSTS